LSLCGRFRGLSRSPEWDAWFSALCCGSSTPNCVSSRPTSDSTAHRASASKHQARRRVIVRPQWGQAMADGAISRRQSAHCCCWVGSNATTFAARRGRHRERRQVRVTPTPSISTRARSGREVKFVSWLVAPRGAALLTEQKRRKRCDPRPILRYGGIVGKKEQENKGPQSR